TFGRRRRSQGRRASVARTCRTRRLGFCQSRTVVQHATTRNTEHTTRTTHAKRTVTQIACDVPRVELGEGHQSGLVNGAPLAALSGGGSQGQVEPLLGRAVTPARGCGRAQRLRQRLVVAALRDGSRRLFDEELLR